MQHNTRPRATAGNNATTYLTHQAGFMPGILIMTINAACSLTLASLPIFTQVF